MRRRSAIAVQAGLCIALLLAATAALVPTNAQPPASPPPAPGQAPADPAKQRGTNEFADVGVTAASSEAAGKYLVEVGGCNDCHTPGYMQMGDKVPEELWLTGVPMGFMGPWGTTYASNLRLFAKDFDEETFVQVVRNRNGRPPMPWPSLHAMSDRDLRAVFRYIRSLPVTGAKTPEALPPGQEPKTPYVVFEPVFPPGTTPPPPPPAAPAAAPATLTEGGGADAARPQASIDPAPKD